MKARIWLAAMVLFISAPALAETPSGTLRLFVSSVRPSGNWSGDLDVGGPIVPTEIEAQDATGFGVIYEVRLGRRFGVESGIYFADFDFDIRFAGMSTDFGSSLAIPFLLGADVHLVTGEHVDVYVGPQVAYTLWGNLDTPFGSTEIDGEFGVGAVAGVDLRLGRSGWTISFGARYLGLALSDPSLKVDVDPLFAEVGIGYRF